MRKAITVIHTEISDTEMGDGNLQISLIIITKSCDGTEYSKKNTPGNTKNEVWKSYSEDEFEIIGGLEYSGIGYIIWLEN